MNQQQPITEQMMQAAREQAIATDKAVFVGYDEEGLAVFILPFSLN